MVNVPDRTMSTRLRMNIPPLLVNSIERRLRAFELTVVPSRFRFGSETLCCATRELRRSTGPPTRGPSGRCVARGSRQGIDSAGVHVGSEWYVVIAPAAFAVFGPRSFSYTTSSWLTIKVITPEDRYMAG